MLYSDLDLWSGWMQRKTAIAAAATRRAFINGGRLPSSALCRVSYLVFDKVCVLLFFSSCYLELNSEVRSSYPAVNIRTSPFEAPHVPKPFTLNPAHLYYIYQILRPTMLPWTAHVRVQCNSPPDEMQLSGHVSIHAGMPVSSFRALSNSMRGSLWRSRLVVQGTL